MAYLVVEEVHDCRISAGNHFMSQGEQPFPQVNVTATVFTRILGNMDFVGKLLQLKLPI